MAEKWQLWMPLYIDRWRGSPEVQAMHPVARSGYLWLLISQWQSADGTISNDDLDLATESGLGDDLWAQYKIRIIRKFDPVPGSDRLRNEVNYIEWLDARSRFERNHVAPDEVSRKRSEAGRKGNRVRWLKSQTDPKSDPVDSQTDPKTSQTKTGTGTDTNTRQEASVGEPTPLAKPRKPSPKAKPPEGKQPSLFTEFRELFDRYYRSKNSEKPAPWDGREGASLSRFMKANPTVTLEEWKSILTNRWNSPCTHSDRLSKWIDNALSWLKGPARDFGKPITGGQSYDKGVRAEQSVREHRAKHASDQEDGPGLSLLALPAAQPGAAGHHGRVVLESAVGSDSGANGSTGGIGFKGDRVLAVPRTLEAAVGDSGRRGKSQAPGGEQGTGSQSGPGETA